MTRVRRFYGHEGQVSPTGLVPASAPDGEEGESHAMRPAHPAPDLTPTHIDYGDEDYAPTSEETDRYMALVDEGLDESDAWTVVWPGRTYEGGARTEKPETSELTPDPSEVDETKADPESAESESEPAPAPKAKRPRAKAVPAEADDTTKD